METISYGRQWIDKRDTASVLRILESRWLTQGPTITKFEEALCAYTGARYAVAVSSGTAALHIGCLVSGLKTGDEVVASPLTFVASVNCILNCNGKPVFADVQSDTGNIDPQIISRIITKKTRALIPVHFAGHPCDMEQINSIAKKNKLIVIEDAAHALGSRYSGSMIGSCRYSDLTILSFHPVKAITTGEGGAVLTNNKTFYEKLLLLRNHGITKVDSLMRKYGLWYYEMQELGFNYRLTDIQSALGISQLRKLDFFLKKRREIVNIYNEAFKENPYFDIPIEKSYAFSSWHLYPIRLKQGYIKNKKSIFSKMRKIGLGVQVHYIPVYLQPYYKKLGFKKGICPAAERFYAQEISLPLYPLLQSRQVRAVIAKTIKSFEGIK